MLTASADMQAFVRAVDLGSFAAAAADLGLTPSALSKLVTRLEDRLGVRLMTRTTRRLSLTPEGELFLARSREVLAAIEAAEAQVTASRRAPRGHLRVNTGTAFGRHQLGPALPAFLARHPDVTVDLGITDRQVDLVAEQVDVAIRTGALGDSTLTSRKIADAARIICASPAYLARAGTPRTPADLAGHDCLVLAGFSRLAHWPFRTAEGINRLAVRGRLACDSADMLLDFALAGCGIVRLADFMAADAIRAGRLVPLLADMHESEAVPVTALMLPGRHRAPRIDAFLAFLVDTFGSRPWALA